MLLAPLELDRQDPMAQGNLRSADLPERERLKRRRDLIQPMESKGCGETSHIRFLVDHLRIEDVIQGTSLSGCSSNNYLRETVNITASCVPGRANQQFCHINASE